MNVQMHLITILFWCFNAVGTYGGELNHFSTPTKQNEGECNKMECEKKYWEAVGEVELEEALNNVPINNVAKNVILFLGDGMGLSTVTASRIYNGQKKGKTGEEGFLVFDKFPYVALSKTYNVDHQVPDSAGTGTAYLTGVKTNMGVIGFDAKVQKGRCDTVTDQSIVQSIAKWSQDKGKRTGVVTSTRITHATPASAYAHIPHRDWECDTFIPSDCPKIKDIARQLVEDAPGKNLNVIMGGGFRTLDGSGLHLVDDYEFPKEEVCIRSDGRKLWKEWLDEKQSLGKSADFVQNKTALNEVDLTSTEYLMGIFANSHIPFEYEKRENNLDLPTLSEMTEAAIKLLSQEEKGFFLLVEGGRIDHAHHSGLARTALDEAVAMNDAVGRALEITNKNDTLIVVTADHSHTMTINGYPKRGNPITGITEGDKDSLPFTTLTYATGPGYNYDVKDGKVVRPDPRLVDTSDWKYRQQAGIKQMLETHAGEDVAIYASGPMAHLFHSVHEQNYIPRVMAYASCVDKEERHCKKGL